jgi:hypothetical protein
MKVKGECEVIKSIKMKNIIYSYHGIIFAETKSKKCLKR